MAARDHRNAVVRAERFLQYRQLLLRGPSALSFSTLGSQPAIHTLLRHKESSVR